MLVSITHAHNPPTLYRSWVDKHASSEPFDSLAFTDCTVFLRDIDEEGFAFFKEAGDFAFFADETELQALVVAFFDALGLLRLEGLVWGVGFVVLGVGFVALAFGLEGLVLDESLVDVDLLCDFPDFFLVGI